MLSRALSRRLRRFVNRRLRRFVNRRLRRFVNRRLRRFGVSGGRPPCALIVDDDPEICRALARCLKPELDVHLAGSVREAEATLAGLARVDLAFVDWMLPDGSGELILEQLVRWPDSIRVLISGRLGSSQGVSVDTASSENPLRNRALANLVLSKPLAFHVVDALKRATLGLPNG